MDGHNLKLRHIVDEFAREALAIECERRIDADKVVSVLDRLVGEGHSYPGLVRCDNGPEMTSNARSESGALLPDRCCADRARQPVGGP
ncbi:MAG: hypothetical protein NVS4B3_17500 [Gemmatimonadaceae bacterium]